MKVSVITAVRNAAQAIRVTLKSVEAQDYADIEHIVVDGASTDGTPEAVKAIGKRVSVFVSEPDSGVYQAFNKGLRRATGDVVAYINAGDEYVSPSVISSVVGAFRDRPVDAVFGDAALVDAEQRDRTLRVYSSARFLPSRLAYGFMPAHPTLFLRKRVYDEVGEYDESYRIAGDFEFCVRAFCRRSLSYHYLPDTLVRMADGGLSNRGWRSKWLITREMHRACVENSVSTSLFKLLLRFPVKALEVRFGTSIRTQPGS